MNNCKKTYKGNALYKRDCTWQMGTHLGMITDGQLKPGECTHVLQHKGDMVRRIDKNVYRNNNMQTL
jgi:hypothetical protein